MARLGHEPAYLRQPAPHGLVWDSAVQEQPPFGCKPSALVKADGMGLGVEHEGAHATTQRFINKRIQNRRPDAAAAVSGQHRHPSDPALTRRRLVETAGRRRDTADPA